MINLGDTTKSKLNTIKFKEYTFCYLMIAISVIHFFIFYVGVNLNSILMAFQDYRGIDEAGNVIRYWNLSNFSRIFQEFSSNASELSISLQNTLKYFAKDLLVMMPLTLIIAYALFKKVPCYGIFRVVFYLPQIISSVVYVTVFKSLIAPFGPLATILDGMFSYELPPLLTNDATATPTILAYTIWTGFGTNMILYQGAMNRIPQEIFESASLDGITPFKEFFMIVLPLIWQTLSMTIVLLFTSVFMASGPILLFSDAGLTAGGHNTSTLSFLIFYKTYLGTTFEYPAAIGLFFTLCSAPIVFGIRFIMNKLDPEVEF